MMNPETKHFERVPDKFEAKDARKDWPQFSVGFTFDLDGVKFRIRKITNKDIVIRPVK